MKPNSRSIQYWMMKLKNKINLKKGSESTKKKKAIKWIMKKFDIKIKLNKMM
jgi:hypothetical protein